MARDNSWSFHGIQVDSEEECMAILYFEELQEKEYVEKIERADTIILSERFENKYQETKILKTKTKVVDKNQILLEEHVYTPEFKITWTPIGELLWTWQPVIGRCTKFISQQGISIIEVKPDYDPHNMTRLFKVNQKMAWKIHKLFINLVLPHELFKNTFTPQTWLKTATGRDRKINWQVRSLDEYIKSLNQTNNNDIQNITEGNTGVLRELSNEPITTENID